MQLLYHFAITLNPIQLFVDLRFNTLKNPIQPPCIKSTHLTLNPIQPPCISLIHLTFLHRNIFAIKLTVLAQLRVDGITSR